MTDCHHPGRKRSGSWFLTALQAAEWARLQRSAARKMSEGPCPTLRILGEAAHRNKGHALSRDRSAQSLLSGQSEDEDVSLAEEQTAVPKDLWGRWDLVL